MCHSATQRPGTALNTHRGKSARSFSKSACSSRDSRVNGVTLSRDPLRNIQGRAEVGVVRDDFAVPSYSPAVVRAGDVELWVVFHEVLPSDDVIDVGLGGLAVTRQCVLRQKMEGTSQLPTPSTRPHVLPIALANL